MDNKVALYPPAGGEPGYFLPQHVEEKKAHGWTEEAPDDAPAEAEPDNESWETPRDEPEPPESEDE